MVNGRGTLVLRLFDANVWVILRATAFSARQKFQQVIVVPGGV